MDRGRRRIREPLGLPAARAARAAAAAENPVDAFVDAALAARGIAPAPEADRVTLARRLAAWWLDLVRYADSVGYHGDQEVTLWPYRDWVLEAFAANKPFDQFTREQNGWPRPTTGSI